MPTAAKRQTGLSLGEGSRAGPTDPAVRFLEIPGGASRSMAARSHLVVAGWGTAWGPDGASMAGGWPLTGCLLAVRWLLTGRPPLHWGPSSLPLPLARACSVGQFSQFLVGPPASYREPAIRADGANGRRAFSSLCVVSSAEAPVQANCRPQPVLAVGVTCREGQSASLQQASISSEPLPCARGIQISVRGARGLGWAREDSPFGKDARWNNS